jgi:acetylornithine deacetylase/succinyl-diaminopimelate desuccinylase-like protein
MHRSTVWLSLLGLLPGFVSAQSSGAKPITDALIEKSATATLPEFVQLLSVPNVSSVPADIQKNTAMLDALFQKRGFRTTVWPNNGRPLLFAELPGADPAKKTILFYMHLDGQPVTPSEWDQESPFTPTLKRMTQSGKWETLPMEQLYTAHPDRELRVFARSAGDDKGPIGMFLSAVDAMRAAGREPAINVKIVLDPEEEGGGAVGLRSFVKERTSVMRADALVVFDGPMGEQNKPRIEFGFRGGVNAQIIVFGPKNEVHSGNYGNYSPNPMQMLARLVGNMKDDDGRVTIPGFYDSVKLTPDVQQKIAAVPFDAAALNKRLGIAAPETVGRNLTEALMYPTLTLSRMTAGSLGPNGKVVPFVGAVIPAVASADIAIRTVPETPSEFLRPVITKYVESQGYHLLTAPPTDEERAKYRKLAMVTVSNGSGGAKTDMNSALGAWMSRAYRGAFGADPEVAPLLGGGLPVGAIIDGLKVPFVISPLANGDDNQHTSNENLRLGNYIDGAKSILALLQEKF